MWHVLPHLVGFELKKLESFVESRWAGGRMFGRKCRVLMRGPVDIIYF